MTSYPTATIQGYPRIGADRELKRALEAFWKDPSVPLAETARALRRERTERLRTLGLVQPDAIPEDFSYYDQVLDLVLATGALPARFAAERRVLADHEPESAEALRAGFTVARGEGDRPALELTKWFDSNYHYLVPEIGPDTEFSWLGSPRIQAVRELASDVRPALVGPVTFLALSKPTEGAPEDYNPLDRLDDLLEVYARYLADLKSAGAQWVQLDEPALVTDRHRTPQTRDGLLDALEKTYARLATAEAPAIAVALPYGHAFDAVDRLIHTNVASITIDVVRGIVPPDQKLKEWSAGLGGKSLGIGIVSGRNIWRTDLDEALSTLQSIKEGLGDDVVVTVTTSTSLQHVPYDVTRETQLDEELKSWLAFADQKVQEVEILARGLAQGADSISNELYECREAFRSRANHPGVARQEVRSATAAVTDEDRTRSPYPVRKAAQRKSLDLPILPTTTIGSFPQTAEIRQARAANRAGKLSDADYEHAMEAEIARVIAAQEEAGLDVLVHGEAERNDMVQYFAEQLRGFATTVHGWVQSYGSRCTRPSILWGDVSRDHPISVKWSAFAQSLTDKPVKGMLTGPVTIMAWSFVREDIPWSEVGDQLGLALRDEISDLEDAGIKIIQVDEPAIRELLPLREEDTASYLRWSVGAFRLATGGAKDQTSIHTHLCYSDFATVVDAIDRLDADVTSIEASRSKLKAVPAIAEHGFKRGLGPGVWDIHSPRVPSTTEITSLLDTATKALDIEQVWVNPDCGLKTRAWPETSATIHNLVEAATKVRSTATPSS